MKRNVILITFVTAIGMALIFSPLALAMGCKGLPKNQCDTNADCSWVNSYRMKSGKTVAAYCRSKAGKSKSGATGKKKNSGAKDAPKHTNAAQKSPESKN
jgi:hypothetical protein